MPRQISSQLHPVRVTSSLTNMARRVFIFGAGASASMGTPVLRDFLDRAHDLFTSVSNRRIVKQDYITKEAFRLVFDVVDHRLPILHGTTTHDAANLEHI